ncbi:hypothetical protein D3C78_1822000 [compost metagenome]
MWLEVLEEACIAGACQGDPFILRRFLTGALSWTITWYDTDGALNLDQLAEQALLLVLRET